MSDEHSAEQARVAFSGNSHFTEDERRAVLDAIAEARRPYSSPEPKPPRPAQESSASARPYGSAIPQNVGESSTAKEPLRTTQQSCGTLASALYESAFVVAAIIAVGCGFVLAYDYGRTQVREEREAETSIDRLHNRIWKMQKIEAEGFDVSKLRADIQRRIDAEANEPE